MWAGMACLSFGMSDEVNAPVKTTCPYIANEEQLRLTRPLHESWEKNPANPSRRDILSLQVCDAAYFDPLVCYIEFGL